MAELAVAKPVDKAVEKYIERARAGKALYEYFIQRPRRGPATAAIAARKNLEEKMRLKETWDKWEARLAGVGDKGVITAAVTKGVPRFVPGIEYGAKFWEQFYKEFKPHLEAGLAEVLTMPKVTLDDSIARAAAMIKHNAKFRFVKKV